MKILIAEGENDFPIKSGETIDSIDKNGDMQMSPLWSAQYEDSN